MFCGFLSIAGPKESRPTRASGDACWRQTRAAAAASGGCHRPPKHAVAKARALYLPTTSPSFCLLFPERGELNAWLVLSLGVFSCSLDKEMLAMTHKKFEGENKQSHPHGYFPKCVSGSIEPSFPGRKEHLGTHNYCVKDGINKKFYQTRFS